MAERREWNSFYPIIPDNQLLARGKSRRGGPAAGSRWR